MATNVEAIMTGLCVKCRETTIDPDRDYQRVTGWEKKRSQGGTNALRLREPHPDEWACVFCIDRETRGQSARQSRFL